jgi:phage-related protein
MSISSLSGLAAYQSGTYAGAIPGTTTTSTTSGAGSLLQGISGANSGIFGAIGGTASTSNNNTALFTALGATGTLQSDIQKATKSVNPNLGNKLDIYA